MANEKRNLIDRDDLIDSLGVSDMEIFAKEVIGDAPTVDAVEVVRCEVCKHHDHCEVETFLRYVDRIENPYCSAGERKDNGK